MQLCLYIIKQRFFNFYQYDESLLIYFSGATSSYLIGKVKCDWARYGDMFTAFCSIVMGVLVMSCYFYDRLIFIYIAYILYGLICQMHFVII